MPKLRYPSLLLSFILFLMLAACAGAPASGRQINTPNLQPEDIALKPFTTALEKLITDTRAVLGPLSLLSEARGSDAAACSALMADKAKAYPQYTALGAAHLNGDLFCLSAAQPNPVNIIDRAYFQRALLSKDIGIGDYQIGRATGKKSAGIGNAILDASNNPQGIVLAPVDLDWLNQHLASIPLPKGGELVLLDSKGIVLAHLPIQMELVGSDVAATPLGKAMLTQTDGNGEIAGLDGVTRRYKFTSPYGSAKNWIVAMGLPK